MKTRKLLFTMIAVMTMMFGLTLTAHAEEATKVVGVEGIGTFTVPADWTEEYIEGYGTYWFNPTKTACVAMSISGPYANGLPSIEVFAPIHKKNLESYGVTVMDWRVTKYFDHDAIDYIISSAGNSASPVNYPVMANANFSYGHQYFVNSTIMDMGCISTTVEELQTVLPILNTYNPAQ